MSPITTALLPLPVKAAHEVKPWKGLILTPSTVTARSVRGTLTFGTPFFTSGWRPVTRAMTSVSGPAAASTALAMTLERMATAVLSMCPPPAPAAPLPAWAEAPVPLDEKERQWPQPRRAGRAPPRARPVLPTRVARLEPLPVRHPAPEDALPRAVRAPAREYPGHGRAERLVLPLESPAKLLLVQELEEHAEIRLVSGSEPDDDRRVVHHERHTPLPELVHRRPGGRIDGHRSIRGVLPHEALRRCPCDHADRFPGPEDAFRVLETRDVLATHGGEQAGAKIRVAEPDQDLTRPGDRQPRHGDVRAPLLDGGDDVAEFQLREVERSAERRRELAGEVDLEPDQAVLLAEGVGRSVARDDDAQRRGGRHGRPLRRAAGEADDGEAYDQMRASHGDASSHIDRGRVHRDRTRQRS